MPEAVTVEALSRARPSRTSEHETKLRVGIVLDSFELPAWQWTMLERLLSADYCALAVVLVSQPHAADDDAVGVSALARAMSSLYAFLDKRFRCDPDALELKNARAMLAGVPVVATSIEAMANAGAGAQPPGDMGTFDLDVLLQIAEQRHIDPHLLRIARYGVWSVYFGDRRKALGRPVGFWEVYSRERVIESGVQMLTARDTEPRVIFRSYGSTEPISVRLTNNNIYWKTLSFLPRKLRELRNLGPERFFARVEAQSPPVFADYQPRGAPSAAEAALQSFRTFSRRLGNLAERVLRIRPWIMLFHFGPGLSKDMSAFRKIVAAKGRYWADPFVIVRDGKHYVFFEEYMQATSKAHLCVFTLARDGTYTTPVTVLDRPYHLSYPFIFEHDGTLYMVPESEANRTVELYRCTHFPEKWEFVENILEDVYAVDTTLLHHEGKWWLFANMTETRGASNWEELSLYYSEKLIAGKWIPHPLNPVISDVRRARPAGAIFFENGCMYRPSQDCSVTYGYATKINRIDVLTEDDYREVEVASIEPHWDRRLTATHTLNHAGGLTMIDALQPRSRL